MTYRGLAGRLTLLVLAAIAGLVLAATAAGAETWADLEDGFATRLNAERSAAGLAPLQVDTQLVRVARDWTAVMVSVDELHHNPALADQVRGPWTRLGENVGTGSHGGGDPGDVVQRLHEAFMASPPHRANALGDYDSLGIGVVVTDTRLWVTVNLMKGGRPADDTTPQIEEALHVSRSVFAAAGDGDGAGLPAQFAIVARAEMFADALAGAALAGREAPILFTPGPRNFDPDPVLHPHTRSEIDRVLGGTGTVYMLGGPEAVSRRVETELQSDGYTVRRLAGATRVETSVAVAQEVLRHRGGIQEALIARADDWADAVSGGAYAGYAGSPLLLTTSDQLHPAVASFLAATQPERRWALGGEAALDEAVVAAAGARRVAGTDRAATAVAIAEELWGRTVATSGDRYVTTPAFDVRGWAYGLAFAPWSAAHRGPQLLVGDDVPASVEAYLIRLGYRDGVSGLVESASAVPLPVVQRVRQLVGS